LKYQRFTSSGCKFIRIRKFEFVVKAQFINSKMLQLYILFNVNFENIKCIESDFYVVIVSSFTGNPLNIIILW